MMLFPLIMVRTTLDYNHQHYYPTQDYIHGRHGTLKTIYDQTHLKLILPDNFHISITTIHTQFHWYNF